MNENLLAIFQIFRIFLRKWRALVYERQLYEVRFPCPYHLSHVTRRCLDISEVSKIQIRIQSTNVDIRKSDGFPSLFTFRFFRHFFARLLSPIPLVFCENKPVFEKKHEEPFEKKNGKQKSVFFYLSWKKGDVQTVHTKKR